MKIKTDNFIPSAILKTDLNYIAFVNSTPPRQLQKSLRNTTEYAQTRAVSNKIDVKFNGSLNRC